MGRSNESEKEKRSLFGAGGFPAWTLLLGLLEFSYLSFFNIPPTLGADGLAQSSNPTLFLMSFLIAGIVVNLSGALGGRLPIRSRPCTIAATVAVLAGYLLAFPSSVGTLDSVLFSPIGGVLVGVGSALLFMEWACAYSRLAPSVLLVASALSTAVAYATLSACLALSTHASLFVSMVAAAASAVPLVIVRRDGEVAGASAGSGADVRAVPVRRSIRDSNTGVGLVLFGAALCQMIDAFTWGDCIIGATTALPLSSRLATGLGAVAGCVAIFVWMVLGRARMGMHLAKVHVFAMPIAAGLLLMGWILPQTTDFSPLIARPLTGCGIGVLLTMYWCEVCSSTDEVGAFLSCASTRFVLMSVALVGVLLPSVAGVKTGVFVTLLAIVVFLVIVAAASASDIMVPEQAVDEVRAAVTAPNSVRFEEVLSDLARSYGLTPREEDVLLMLGAGHSTSFCAEKMCVSPSTIKTHAKHLYTKMGVHSRDELLEKVTEFMSQRSSRP